MARTHIAMSVSLTPDDWAAMRAAAKDRNVSAAELVRRAVAEYVAAHPAPEQLPQEDAAA